MTERRPIASRNTKWADKAARRLAHSGVTANQISQASMGFALVAGLAFWGAGVSDGALGWLLLILAALGCQGRLLCNLFDGMVAMEGGKAAKDGPFWNEAPDRVSDLLIFVGMGLGAGLPWLGWAAAALAIATAYVRELGTNTGLAADFSGPMAKPQRMAVATAVAILAIPNVYDINVLALGLWIIAIGAGVTAIRRSARIIRGLHSR